MGRMPNPIDERFAVAEALLTGLFEHRNPVGLIFAGPPGLGKSELVRRMCRRYGHAWRPIRPSAKGLVQHVYENNGSPLVFDDFDDVFHDIRTLGVFKVLLDSHASRVLSNDVADPRYRIPPFEVESPAVFLSNLDFDDDTAFAPRVRKSAIPALKSRTRIITLPFDKKAILDYTLRLAPAILQGLEIRVKVRGNSFPHRLSRPKITELIDHLERHYDRYPEVSPRMIKLFGELRISHPDDEKWHLIRETQLKSIADRTDAATGSASNATAETAVLQKRDTLIAERDSLVTERGQLQQERDHAQDKLAFVLRRNSLARFHLERYFGLPAWGTKLPAFMLQNGEVHYWTDREKMMEWAQKGIWHGEEIVQTFQEHPFEPPPGQKYHLDRGYLWPDERGELPPGSPPAPKRGRRAARQVVLGNSLPSAA
jgi:hypothetical protein